MSPHHIEGTIFAFWDIIPINGDDDETICFWYPMPSLFAVFSLQNSSQNIYANHSRISEISLRPLWLHLDVVVPNPVDAIK